MKLTKAQWARLKWMADNGEWYPRGSSENAMSSRLQSAGLIEQPGYRGKIIAAAGRAALKEGEK